jgi:hypothetical protein
MAESGRTDNTKLRNVVLKPLLEAGLLEMTIPDKPRSSKQSYRITKLGSEALDRADEQSLMSVKAKAMPGYWSLPP